VCGILIGTVASVSFAQIWPGRSETDGSSCRPDAAGRTAAQWLAAARDAVGLTRLGGRAIRYAATDVAVLQNQSDRPYPPFLLQPRASELWFNASNGAEFSATPGAGRRGMLRTDRNTFMVRDTLRLPNPALHTVFEVTRALNPLAVLADWTRAGDAAVEGSCSYRGYPRTVLRSIAVGARLFLDMKTGFPIKLEREEPHYLWGQVVATYLYQTWWHVGDVFLPVTATRAIDGVDEVSRALDLGANATTIEAASVAWLAPSPNAPDMRHQPHPMLNPAIPDTVRVGPRSFLLVNPSYTHAVTLVRDTVFLFDASIGEGRSRQDSTWIARLFPGKHPIALVVTDLAWPHIAGVRFWAARGATIVTHRLSQPFLAQVLARRWTGVPDALEAARARTKPVFRLTDRSLALAGGAITLAPIDGVGSEGALMAYLRDDDFLWAGDYIQSVQGPALYTNEVWRATRREGIVPRRTAAQHLPLTEWSAVTAVVDTTTRP
jgi:hypothetical protein